MKGETLQAKAEATRSPALPQPADPASSVPPQGGLTGPYWDALRKLPRVRVGGSMTSGLVFSRSEACHTKPRRQP